MGVDTYGAHLAEGLSALRGAPATSKRRGENRRSAQARIVRGASSTPSVTALSELLAEAVYFVRTSDDLVKIGHTTNVADRIAAHGGWSTVLAIVPGTYADEQALHAGLTEFRARGREFYRPEPAILDHVDVLRETMGLRPVDRWVTSRD